MLWKVCGMRDAQNVMAVDALGVDYLGFIRFEGSSRHVSTEQLVALNQVATQAQKVHVSVNAGMEALLRDFQQFDTDVFQLHGDETPQECAQLKAVSNRQVWKAVSMGAEADLQRLSAYEGHVDAFVLDAKGAQRGGNGVRFDWSILKEYTLSTPFFISGGVDAEALEHWSLLAELPVIGVDVNSRFEDAPALKNSAALAEFKEQLNERT